MSILLKGLREGLGRLIVGVDWIFSPKPIQRSAERQAQVDEAAHDLALYQFYACPFCIKTRRAIKRLNVPIETRNAQAGEFRAELLEKGGEVKVPCLKIVASEKTIWLYESDDIITYLEHRFGVEAP